MRTRYFAAIILGALLAGRCATRRTACVEVTPRLCLHCHSYAGSIGSPNYEDITNYWVTNCYTPFVVSEGAPFSIDFAQHDTFTSPDTGAKEKCFNGVITHLRVTVSNTVASFSGRTEFNEHLGVTSSYNNDDRSLYGQTLRSYSTRFDGTCTLGQEMQIGAGEDIDDEPVVCFTFRRCTAPLSKFNPESAK